MRVLWAVFQKEFLDILRDRRRLILMIVSMFIVFPLMFVAPYAFLITRATVQSVDVLTIPVQGMEQAPSLMTYLLEEHDIHAIPAEDVEALVADRQYPVGLIVPADYEEKIAGGQSVELTLVSDRRRTMNLTTTRLSDALEEYGQSLMEARLKERGLAEEFFTPLIVERQNAVTSTETTGSMLGLIIPGIIISIALSAGMPMAISTVAGEKKKLTLEPVLFTTVSRVQLVFAKLLAVLTGVILVLGSMAISSAISGVAVILILARTLPMDKIIGSAEEAASTSSSVEVAAGGYQIQPLAILLFVLAPFLIILLGAALQILVSTWARNDEEANTYLTPLNLLSGVVIIGAIFLDEYVPQLWHYGLPVFGTIISMRDLLSNKVDPASLTVMFVSSALYAFVLLAVAVWMFHREEVVFRA